jgi:ribonuclease HI
MIIAYIDGGARGNPGPAGFGVRVERADGTLVEEFHDSIGTATNNVAEYRGLLLGLERAKLLGATEIEVINDSELVAHQVNGRYKVKHPDMKPLHASALEALRGFERWSIRPVPRAENAEADALVNQALDGERA